jgi:hypothetical protein
MGTIFSILASLFLAAVLLFGTPIARLWGLPRAVDAPEIRSEARPQIYTPPPLRRETAETRGAFLTPSGIFLYTNAARENNGLPTLSRNAALDKVAEARLRDMFAKQYFAHYSPDGRGAAEEANVVGYEYLAIGENLALGNFEGDLGVVDAWMGSPGHRANILSGGYTEIGVAAEKGLFEGKSAWLAVQIFGLPRSVCPAPEAGLKDQLDTLQNEVVAKQYAIESLKTELEGQKPRGREEIQEYNRKVDEYNALVREYNQLVQLTKSLVTQYNGQVETFNACLNTWR